MLRMAMTGGSASAHHSFAMFDQQQDLTLVETESGVEMSAPPSLLRGGWNSKALKPGETISVVVHVQPQEPRPASMTGNPTGGLQTLGAGGRMRWRDYPPHNAEWEAKHQQKLGVDYQTIAGQNTNTRICPRNKWCAPCGVIRSAAGKAARC